MARDLPRGTVTFLFTDIEGSTRLLHELGASGYSEALMEHRRVLRKAVADHGGVEVDTQGDAFFVAFPGAPDALAAAADALADLATSPIKVRMGLHTGTPHTSDEGYVGVDVHRAARIAACGHGGQVLLSAATATLTGTDQLRALGKHRLKDLSAPEQIYQLGDHEFPPLRSLHSTNLPVPANAFLGRRNELSEVVALLSAKDIRLLTLTGAGGTGKTRLALQAAAAVADHYPHGIWWVPLANLREPQLVVESAEAALGAQNGLQEHIGDKEMLLFFDNFEQVIDAADEVAKLLAADPNLHVLVTSREPLRLRGEQEYPVPPLAADESVDFFVTRARAAKPDFAPDAAVVQICRRLDDLPLALELAAARVKMLSPVKMLARLEHRLPLLTGGTRDAPERQRTLRGAIEWSYDLLTPDEQRLFAQLAVFRGGCTLESAEDVTGGSLDTLRSLVDKSLVRCSADRFWMLETILEYATERLGDGLDANALRRRHAEHFLALAEEADPHLAASRDLASWLAGLQAEHDNLRAALDWFSAVGETQQVLRLAGALTDFWDLRGHLVEGRRLIETALEADLAPTAARARALDGAGELAAATGDIAAAERWGGEAVELHLALDDVRGAALSQHLIAYIAAERGDWTTAQHLAEQVLETFRNEPDEHLALRATRLVAWTSYELGDRERARELHEDNLRRARARGDTFMHAATLGGIASSFALPAGDVTGAAALLRESLPLWQQLGEGQGLTLELSRCGATLMDAGKVEIAAAIVACVKRVRAEQAFDELWASRMIEEVDAGIRGQLDGAAYAEAASRGRAMSLDDAVELALEALP